MYIRVYSKFLKSINGSKSLAKVSHVSLDRKRKKSKDTYLELFNIYFFFKPNFTIFLELLGVGVEFKKIDL